ncbi:hypothetical protein B1H18_30430 [Streptomyces tsukubensis]|uniref:Uncharacterized protein n=1 Tax=Streptomyces tsukubensis TaxID=83656 RepID=A0A1V4A151_9ACTN|nr:hypothetical protein B1H18_30430 [Streptomyces tsukubensis]
MRDVRAGRGALGTCRFLVVRQVLGVWALLGTRVVLVADVIDVVGALRARRGRGVGECTGLGWWPW